MSDDQKSVLITGANRGVGLALSRLFVKRGYKVVAAVRDLSKAPPIEGLAAVVKIDSNKELDSAKAIEELKAKGIDDLDIVIANAGIASPLAYMRDTNMSAYDEYFRVNTKAPLSLFIATYPLLKKKGSKFIVISSAAAQNSMEHFKTNGTYGASKAAINYITRQIHFEEPHLTAFTLAPGFLDTDMGIAGAKELGLGYPPEKVSITAPKMVDLVEKSDRESRGGYMWN
ncbi:hypothetical protein V866_007416 [Kwoniella sp. B9012]